MSTYSVNVVSYKRPNNNTCKLLAETTLNWEVFVYKFDPYYNEYLKLYTTHVHPLSFEKPNLPMKRQAVLDWSLVNNIDYCIMLDDDIEIMEDARNNSQLTIREIVNYLLYTMKAHTNYIALSTGYNKSNDNFNRFIEDYKNVCNNSIFNMKLYAQSNIKYNSLSKCEDMELTMDFICNGYKTGRLKYILVHNILQGGLTGDGLSYRFDGTNRFIEEGQYMSKKYSKFKDAFEYDETHFKMNTKKLIEILSDITKGKSL